MSDSDLRPEMDPEDVTRGQAPQREEMPSTEITPELRDEALEKLFGIGPNPDQDFVGMGRLLDEELQVSSPVSARQKLIAAEYLALLANHLDPDVAPEDKLANGAAAGDAVELIAEAKKLALEQVLPQLKDIEEVAIELDLWHQNGNFANGDLPDKNTTVYMVPSLSPSFGKFFRRELMDANDRPTDSGRVAVVVLNAADFANTNRGTIAAQSQVIFGRAKPYLAAVAEHNAHAFLGVPLDEGIGSVNTAVDAFGSKAARGVFSTGADQNVLSATSILVGELSYRDAHEGYGEESAPTIPMVAAYAGEATRQQDASAAEESQKRNYSMPGIPLRAGGNLQLTNTAAVETDLDKMRPASLNVVRTVDGQVYQKGGVTLFPREGLDHLDQTELIVRQQTAARMTHNRIKAQLKKLLWKREDMREPDATELRREIMHYLQEMKSSGQIKEFKIQRCETDPDDPKYYDIDIVIGWMNEIESFRVTLISDRSDSQE